MTFSVPIKLLLIKVAAQPESSKILILFQSFAFLVSLVEAKNPIVIDDSCSIFDFLRGLSKVAVEPKYS